jgi:tetratricopeptide (TPR) repeat protein
VTPESRIRRRKIQREAEGYLELGLPRQALGALGRLGDPTCFDSRALYLWGEALRAMDRYEEALVPLSQAVESDAENIYIWIALGWCYKRTGRLDLAIEAVERALAADPDEPLLHYNLACYCSLAGDRDRAVQCLARAVEMEPSYRDMVDGEPDFDPVRSDPDFQAVCSGSVPRS